MIGPDLRIEGFDALSWARLLSLVTGSDPDHPDPHRRDVRQGDATGVYGTLVVFEDAQGRAVAAFQTRRGAIDVRTYTGRERLAALCEAHRAERAVCVRQEAIAPLLHRLSERLDAQRDYGAQWLLVGEMIRDLIDDGQLCLWPPPVRRLRIPNERVIDRALDLLLPAGHTMLLVLWQGTELWTGAALRRGGSTVDWIAGPDQLRAWTGPLGGDWRRDHLVIARAVSRAVAPLHFGLYAQAPTLQALLRDPDPGAWARGIAVRDLIIHPAPPYVGVAVGADAFRALTAHSSRWLRGFDIAASLAPLARFARSQVDQIASVRDILGFSPLEQLGDWLRRRPQDGGSG